jgi:hypothetical protein
MSAGVMLPAGARITAVEYTAVGQYTITFQPPRGSTILDSQRLLAAMSAMIQGLASWIPTSAPGNFFGIHRATFMLDMSIGQRMLAELLGRSPALSIASGVDAYNVWFEAENLELGESASFSVQFYGYEDYRPLRNVLEKRTLKAPTEAELTTYDFIRGTRAKIISDPEQLRTAILRTWRWFRREVRRLSCVK